MGFFDNMVGLFPRIADLPGLTDKQRKSTLEKADTIPPLGDRLAEYWRKHKTDETTDLRSLYEILETSHAGQVGDYEILANSLPDTKRDLHVTAEELWQYGADVNRFSPRVPGTRAMDAASEYALAKLKSFGIQAWSEPLNFQGTFFKGWSLEVDGTQYVTFPENQSGFADVETQIVYIGTGTPEDYQNTDERGKILLIDWGPVEERNIPVALKKRDRLLQTVDDAYAHGAVALIGFFPDIAGNALKITEPGIKPVGGSNIWGQAETGEHGFNPIPVLTIGQTDGRGLVEKVKAEYVTAHVKVTGENRVSTTQIIAGILPGLTNEVISVGCHSDTAFAGGVCDTSGVAGVLGIAKHYASLPVEQRRKSLFFFFDSFHVWGNCCQVAQELLHRHTSLAAQITSFVWLDHFSDGQADTAPVILVSDNPVYWPLSALLAADRGIVPFALPFLDIWSVCATGAHEALGVPSISVQKANLETLTTEDTWAKFDPQVFYRDVAYHIDFIDAIQQLDVPQDDKVPPVTGCGSLFDETVDAEYPAGVKYEPWSSYPLYVGGAASSVRIFNDPREKDATIGNA